jgi:hypothetical protein
MLAPGESSPGARAIACLPSRACEGRSSHTQDRCRAGKPIIRRSAGKFAAMPCRGLHQKARTELNAPLTQQCSVRLRNALEGNATNRLVIDAPGLPKKSASAQSTRRKNHTNVGASIHMSAPFCHDGPAWPCTGALDPCICRQPPGMHQRLSS